ncbi:MAG: serine hydrolase domain-containing protein [Marinifilaceae bacterium]
MKTFVGILTGLVLLFIIWICLPFYMRTALIHWYPNIDDTYIFAGDTLRATANGWEWNKAKDYNAHTLTHDEDTYLDEHKTVSFLVIQNDSIIYEDYRDGWDYEKLSNVFSVTKSVTALLVGAAMDDGYISSLNETIGRYLPEFRGCCMAGITIRELLTMSSGLSWDEAYTSLKSKTTEAYYGDNIRATVTNQTQVQPAGVAFKYKSGDTQLLSLVVEEAMKRKGDTISITEYAYQKLWKPMHINRDAIWNLDKVNGTAKTYCCLNTTARDIAKLGRLVASRGIWDGDTLISPTYVDAMVTPAAWLNNQFGEPGLDYYGYQIWMINTNEGRVPYFRGLGGQYIYIVPQRNAIIVRLGHKKDDKVIRERTEDVDYYYNLGMKIINERD